ncbi:MAG: ATP-dependent helicase HrpB [Phycisphaerales bacterium]|nr:ATP-dependent helicase HrpB [Phycisphaerales bacterium]
MPVRRSAEAIVSALRRDRRLVLAAPTGSGKTTQVPQIVLESGLADESAGGRGQIAVLEPRRLATRMVAERVAAEMGERVGEPGSRVGYQTRHESRMGPKCRIRFMTEGLFLRVMLGDPALRGIDCVILDEFHERSVDADLVLGLLTRAREDWRKDLRVVVMSATLDVERLGGFLGVTPLVVEGRAFPVEVRYLGRRSALEPWDLAAETLASAMAASDGDALVFMPGVFEINRTIRAARTALARAGVEADLRALHGSLPPREQDAAVAPGPRRKAVVATNVAETSLTIPGIRIVVDSGLARIHRYDPQRGINALRVEPISRASAEQRAGRAGRTAPGVCVRLWTEGDHAARAERDAPEVRRIELSEPVLHLASMGMRDPMAFPWLDPPESVAVEQATSVLERLGALGSDGALSETGRLMARFPLHPRLGRMLVEASRRRCLARCVVWAALVGERDILVREELGRLVGWMRRDEPASDLTVREGALDEARAARFEVRRCEAIGVSAMTARDVDRAARQLEGICRRARLPLDGGAGANDAGQAIRCLLTAFDDHVAVRSDPQRPHCAMPGRRRVTLSAGSVVRDAGPLVAVEQRQINRGDDADVVLALASRVDEPWLAELFPDRVERRKEEQWNETLKATEIVEVTLFDGIETSRVVKGRAAAESAEEQLVERIRRGELRLKRWDESVEQWIRRVRRVAALYPERGLIQYEPDDIAVILHEIVAGATRFNQVEDRPCLGAVKDALSWDDQRFVEKMTPSELPLPSGRKLRLEYPEEGPPVGRARIQELYGLTETPRIAGGRQEVLLEILAPNHRPVQRTTDLAGFWERLYPELKKELKRRYPRHEWR